MPILLANVMVSTKTYLCCHHYTSFNLITTISHYCHSHHHHSCRSYDHPAPLPLPKPSCVETNGVLIPSLSLRRKIQVLVEPNLVSPYYTIKRLVKLQSIYHVITYIALRVRISTHPCNLYLYQIQPNPYNSRYHKKNASRICTI